MKIAFILLLVVHGLIHLMGFSKAFELLSLQQLRLDIPKQLGLIWLLAGLLFIIAALFFLFKNNYWWIFSFTALITSQLLIISSWQDAKYGTIVNVIVLLASIGGISTYLFHEKYTKDVKDGLGQTSYFDNSPLSEADISGLPEPVQRYIRYTGFIGKPKVNNFKLEFTGKLRKNEQTDWMPMIYEQYNFMAVPSRLFFMKAKMKHLPVAGYHRFINGDASMDIRLFSLFRVEFQDGELMDKAETVTFFNDMCCMAPGTLIDKRISWQEVDKNKVLAHFSNNGIRISAELYFNEKGELINFISNDRYNIDEKKQLPWSTPLTNYQAINGYKLATYAEAIYRYRDRNMCYGTFELKSAQYNVPNTN